MALAITQARITTGVGVATLLRTCAQASLHEDVVVTNRGGAAVFLGGSDVLTTTGLEVSIAEKTTLRLDAGQSVYAISAAAQRVDVLINPTGDIGGD